MTKDILPELNGKEYTEDIFRDYNIDFCKENEYDDLRMFLKKYWKENHIFVCSKEVFDFQHFDREKKRYNYVIAREKSSGEICAILGFVPTSQFDKDMKRTMIWPCIWKNRKDVNRKGLGVTMYYYLKTNLSIETISILGISEIALSIYKYWHMETGKMEQYVMPNFTEKDYIAKGLSEVYNKFSDDSTDTLELSEIDERDYKTIMSNDLIFSVNSIYKTKEYYFNRFYKHPIYQYNFLAIKDEKKIVAIIIVRSCKVENRKCLRIVDFIGRVDYLICVKEQLQTYLQQYGYEYIDFVEVGIDSEILQKAGFINRRDYKNVVVPNYFEPFVQENIDLDYAYKTVVNDSKKIFFKADADQDRPNILTE